MGKEKELKKTKAHTIYRLSDGTRVPGVTTILGVLNKPALVKWANNLGLQGIDSYKYVDSKAAIGTICHYLIECDVKGIEPELSEYSPAEVSQAENGFLKWLDWRTGKNFELIGSEMPLVSEKHRYGGAIDIFAKLDGKNTLIDIKTSGSGIWPEMRHQVVAYRNLLIENGYTVDDAYILRVGRDESEGFQYEKLGSFDEHFEMFCHCLEIYRLQKLLK
jgi:hypothetical protein